MDIQQAIENITFYNNTFPQSEFDCISANRDEAIPLLREAVEKAVANPHGLEKDYQLHFYALFFLAEFQDREFFPKLIELASLPDDNLDFLIGDAVTDSLPNILYNTYNGDMELLKETASNDAVNEYARAGILDVMGQLYLDGELDAAEWKEFIKERVYSGEEYSYIYDALAHMICDCHFVDLLPEIRYLQDNGLMDPMTMGGYDSCVDIMFRYSEYKERFCKESVRAEDIKHWAMFEQEPGENSKAMTDAFKTMLRKEMQLQAKNRKVGRNDFCPCGSGKKYKFCCLNKPKSPLDSIESEVERNKCLRHYPYIGDERKEGRVYLRDYYDDEAIEIDKLLYLGLMHRPVFIWDRNEEAAENRCREYLKLAFDKFEEKIHSDHTESFAAYDEKYSIHYFSADWVGRLLDMLDRSDEMYGRVKSCCERQRKHFDAKTPEQISP